MKEDYFETLLDIVKSNLQNIEISKENSNDDLSLLGMNSISFIRIVVALEKAFEIEIPADKLLIPEMCTLNKMLEIVLTEKMKSF
jgi:acyl carrier protein